MSEKSAACSTTQLVQVVVRSTELAAKKRELKRSEGGKVQILLKKVAAGGFVIREVVSHTFSWN